MPWIIGLGVVILFGTFLGPFGLIIVPLAILGILFVLLHYIMKQ